MDLYAGSGAVGIEAISRGAEFVWFAEKAPAAVAAMRANLRALKIGGGYALEDRDVARLLSSLEKRAKAEVNMVFLDPPYEATEEYERTMEFFGVHMKDVLAEDAGGNRGALAEETAGGAVWRVEESARAGAGRCGAEFLSARVDYGLNAPPVCWPVARSTVKGNSRSVRMSQPRPWS